MTNTDSKNYTPVLVSPYGIITYSLVVLNIVEKPGVHKILGASAFVPPVSKEDFPKQFELNKIMLHCIAEDSNIGDEVLNLYVQSRLGLHEDDCVVSVVDTRALITFSSEYTIDGK